MNTPLVCIALLVLLGFALGFYVSIARTRAQVMCGYPDDPEAALYKVTGPMATLNPMRFLGALSTYFGRMALVVALLLQANGGSTQAAYEQVSDEDIG